MDLLFKKNLAILKKLDNQRNYWLILSIFICVSIFILLINWDIISNNKFLWLYVSCGLTITVLWWYWTMILIKKLIQYKIIESRILLNIARLTKEVKSEIKKSNQNT